MAPCHQLHALGKQLPIIIMLRKVVPKTLVIDFINGQINELVVDYKVLELYCLYCQYSHNLVVVISQCSRQTWEVRPLYNNKPLVILWLTLVNCNSIPQLIRYLAMLSSCGCISIVITSPDR